MDTGSQRTGRRRVRRVAALVVCALALLAGTASEAAAKQSAPEYAKVVFSPVNDSGVEGAASLEAKGGHHTLIEIQTDGAMGDNPTHIHQGSCNDLDPNPQWPLTNIQLRSASLTGTSATTVDVSLAELLDTPHLILIHKSAKDIGTYFACGNIVAGRLSSSEQMVAGAAEPFPNTGAGIADERSTTIVSLLVSAATVLLAAGVALSLSRRRPVLRSAVVRRSIAAETRR